MGRSRILIVALVPVQVLAACGSSTTPAPTSAPATPAPSTTTPAPATSTPQSAAREIRATVTFDGKTCTYAGPTVVPSGSVIDWTLVETAAVLESHDTACLVVLPARYGTTWEEIVASADRLKGDEGDQFPWLGAGSYQQWSPQDMAAGTPMRTLLGTAPHFAGCVTGPEGTNRWFPAVLIQIMKG
jgi:hypothetical protein